MAPHTQGASEAWLGIIACMRWPVPVTYLRTASWCAALPRSSWSVEARPGDQLRGRTSCATRCRAPRAAHPDGDGHTSSWLAEQPDERRDRPLPHQWAKHPRRTPSTPTESRRRRLRPALRLAVSASCGYSRSGGRALPLGTDLQPVHERQTTTSVRDDRHGRPPTVSTDGRHLSPPDGSSVEAAPSLALAPRPTRECGTQRRRPRSCAEEEACSVRARASRLGRESPRRAAVAPRSFTRGLGSHGERSSGRRRRRRRVPRFDVREHRRVRQSLAHVPFDTLGEVTISLMDPRLRRGEDGLLLCPDGLPASSPAVLAESAHRLSNSAYPSGRASSTGSSRCARSRKGMRSAVPTEMRHDSSASCAAPSKAPRSMRSPRP